jgi:hypothetical protein
MYKRLLDFGHTYYILMLHVLLDVIRHIFLHGDCLRGQIEQLMVIGCSTKQLC